MRPGVAVEKRHVPLNTRAKFRVVTSFRTSKSAIRNMEIQGGLFSHAAEKRRLVLHGMGSDKQNAVPALRHGGDLLFLRDARQAWGRRSGLTRCPAAKYNPVPE